MAVRHNNIMFYALCAKAKATCKPFDTDGAQRKAKEEMVR